MMQSPKEIRRILPGATIGIMGGGQLGRMMALAGRAMGYRFMTLDPTPDSPCGQVCDTQIEAPYSDEQAAFRLAEGSDVITYEFENVDAKVTEALMNKSYVPQGSELLYVTQHRLREKRALEAAGAAPAPFAEIRSLADLRRAVEEFGLPCVLKTCTGGYDGKGQRVLREPAELEEAYAALSGMTSDMVLEQFVPFTKEISVIAARSPAGEIRTFPAAENVHVNNILHLSIVPARISEALAEKAARLAEKIAESLQAVGLVAVEMFVTEDERIYVNELAPRPHNSGHYTMDACAASQFEQHLRAVCNLPLSPTDLLTPVVMVNILGDHLGDVMDFVANARPAADGPAWKLHLYGKKESRIGRKMGHLNVLADDVETALKWIADTGIWHSSN